VNWLSELDANGTLGVGFGGGEPTLYPRFAELCSYTYRETGLALTFTTHAHHLDDALIEELKGNVHFVRVSMDGVGATYERLRGRSFDKLCGRVLAISKLFPFGINYVVNSDTLPDLNESVAFAEAAGASEFLLLPEQPVRGRSGVDASTVASLGDWVNRYSGRVRLAISERGSEGMPTCDPFKAEIDPVSFAHIDANGRLKRASFDIDGVDIGTDGVMLALLKLSDRQSIEL
jgi:MoaA/NifB/PqqE/SkfB family radical SAM enzyme